MLFVKKVKLVQIWCCLLLCIFVGQTSATEAGGNDKAMRILTEDSGPGNTLKNGKAAGYNVELVREILKRVNHIDNIQVLPWARAYMMLQTQANIVLFSTTRTPERESLFKWVGPTSVNNWVMYKRKDSNLHISSLEDAKKVHYIGVYRDDVRHKFLLDEGFTNLSPMNLDHQNLSKLKYKRIDLWMSSNVTFYGETETDPTVLAEFEEALVVKRNYLYIAMSLNTPDEVVKKWQNALHQIKKDGTYKRIMSSHRAGAIELTFDPAKPAVIPIKN
jgi:ABC-type amino acid transport substrate-binding protein